MNFWYRYRYIAIASLAVFLLSFALAYYYGFHFAQRDFKGKPSVAGTVVSGDTPVIPLGARKLTLQKQFTLCHHLLLKKEDVTYVNDADLMEKYPSSEGWSMESFQHKVILTQEVAGFCPQDEAKRHLGVLGKYVAVYVGPSGCGGDLIRVTPIEVKRLSKEWQEKLFKGDLEFTNEAKLFEALDNFDEFGR